MKLNKAIVAGVAVAALAIALSASAVGYTFSNYLSVGSTGADVTALQSWLIANGFNIPAISSGAAAKGYFGSQTQAAVKGYQASVGIPNTGFVGPLTIASLNKGAVASTGTTGTVAVNCPAGFTCIPSNTTPVVSSSGKITTPGVPGILSVTAGPISTSVVNAGAQKAALIDARLQAQYSDVSIQSITVDIGTSTNFYNFVFSTLYVIDPSTNTVLASVPLNPSTVVQSGNDYIVGIAGFNFVVPKGQYKDLVVAADSYNQVSSQYIMTYTVSVPGNGVRGVDGAGVNLYGPISAFSQPIVLQQSLITNASANTSLDASSPLVSSVAVTNTTQGTYLGLPVLVFDVNAQGDNLHLHNVTVNFGLPAGQGSVTAAYLYQGSTPIASAAVTTTGTNGTATFSNIVDGQAGANIPVNTTVPFTIKVDVSGLTAVGSAQSITASTSAATIYNSLDSGVNVSGLPTSGNAVTVFGSGAVFSLSGTPSIAKTNITAGGATTTTFQYTATFNVNAMSVGQNVLFGLPSGIGSFGSSTTSANLAQVYVNGVATSSAAIPLVASYSQPSNTTLASNGNYFTLSQNQSITIPVTYSFTVNNPGANTYAVQLNGIQTSSTSNTSTTTTSFMSGQPAWRTASI